MLWSDLLWVLGYPIYQVIGTFRHESAHALAAMAFGGVIEEFVFLPTRGYWGYVNWEGPSNLFTFGAPYLLDLLTFLVFFTICMLYPFRRRWIWLNLVIIGVVSPLVNSAYNYRPNPNYSTDVDYLLKYGDTSMVHGYFILSLTLYALGLYLLFTRASMHARSENPPLKMTFLPAIAGAFLLLSACTSTLQSGIKDLEATSQPKLTESSNPPPVVRSATMTPTRAPYEEYDHILEQVLAFIKEEYTERGPGDDLIWEGGYRRGAKEPVTVLGEFKAGEWTFRLFDWNQDDPSDSVDISIYNHSRYFRWSGYAQGGRIVGTLVSGGIVPNPSIDDGSGDWLIYSNERYGYRFKYPPSAQVIEHGVSWIDSEDVPEGLTFRDVEFDIYKQIGPNLCVEVVIGDGYIRFDPPENSGSHYTFCRYRGPGALGWEIRDRSESLTIEDRTVDLEGVEIIRTNGEGDQHDEALSVALPSDITIEVGAYSHTDGSYDTYRTEVLPVLLEILETYETITRSPSPQ